MAQTFATGTVSYTIVQGQTFTQEQLNHTIDNVGYAYARLNVIASDLREFETLTGSDNARLWQNEIGSVSSSRSGYLRSAGIVYRLPEPLPGTGNALTASGDDSHLLCESLGKDCISAFGIRSITINNTTGIPSTTGSWEFVYGIHDSSGFQWVEATQSGSYLNIPSGSTSGDLVELCVLHFQSGSISTTTGSLAGFHIYEPQIVSASTT